MTRVYTRGVAVVLGLVLVGVLGVRAQHQARHPSGDDMKKSGQMMTPVEDASYVQMMLVHHQMGLDMTRLAEQKARREDVSALAKKTNEARQKDMEQLRRIQQALKAATAGRR